MIECSDDYGDFETVLCDVIRCDVGGREQCAISTVISERH